LGATVRKQPFAGLPGEEMRPARIRNRGRTINRATPDQEGLADQDIPVSVTVCISDSPHTGSKPTRRVLADQPVDDSARPSVVYDDLPGVWGTGYHVRNTVCIDVARCLHSEAQLAVFSVSSGSPQQAAGTTGIDVDLAG
jgi:hypothetical protein